MVQAGRKGASSGRVTRYKADARGFGPGFANRAICRR